jgi:L,D-transpeptidase YcbB
MRHERVIPLRRRLIMTGDLAPGSSEHAQIFDGTLAEAVKVFQRRHGFTADGTVGSETLAALNVPLEDRIQQLRVNLERARWVVPSLGSTFIVVNVAGYHAPYVKDGQMLWQGRAQVGRPYRQTPIFNADMTYVVFNRPPFCTWSMPMPAILWAMDETSRLQFAIVSSQGFGSIRHRWFFSLLMMRPR